MDFYLKYAIAKWKAGFCIQIQRNLQLRIEEQGKHLQMMFEQQRKMEEEKSKATSLNLNEPSEIPIVEKQPSVDDTEAESSDHDHSIITEVATETCTENQSKKEISSERETCCDQPDGGGDSPPLKRAKTDETGDI